MSAPDPTLKDVLDAVHEVSRTVHGHTVLLQDQGRKLAGHDQRFDGIDTRLDGIDTRLDGIDTRLDGIDTRLDGIDTRLDGIDMRFDGIDTRFDGIDRRFDGIDRRSMSFEHRLDAHDKRFDEHSESLRALSASVRDIWQLLSTMNRRNNERFDNLEMQVFKQREEFAALKGHVTVSIGVLKDLIEARDFRLDDHGRRLNALETPRPTEP